MTEVIVTARTTLYADQDNTPKNSDQIAYPKSAGYPTVHNATGGTGTEADPITCAVDKRDFPVGTRFYSKNLYAYFIAEDLCAASVALHNAGKTPPIIDLFAGGKGQSANTMTAYEESLDQTQDLIMNPSSGKLVIVGPLFETGRKAGTPGKENTGAVPDTSMGTTTPPPPPPSTTEQKIMQVPAIFGWGGDPWVHNDSLLSFQDGAIRVTGSNWPAANIIQPVTVGRQTRFNVEFLDPNGWMKVTDHQNGQELGGVFGVTGPQTITITPITGSVDLWVGVAGSGSVRFINLTTTAL
jgi:3D (Asp-Asp-Asp) domain-containing protein